MVISEVLQEIKNSGLQITEQQLRWSIKKERIARPRMDRSLRFDFTQENVDEAIAYFRSKQTATV